MDFDEVYRLYFRDVYLYIRGLCRNEAVAEEIAQEAFMKALKSIDRFDGRGSMRAWLFAIARNTFFTWHKRRKIYVDCEIDETLAADVTLAENLENEETAFQIHAFLHEMKEPYKEVFSLRVFGELSFEKIGRIFGRSANWARVTYFRAKMQILDYMEASGNEQNQL